MIAQRRQHRSLLPELCKALQAQETYGYPDWVARVPAWRREISRVTADTLLDWCVPPTVAIAALLTPLLEYSLTTSQNLTAEYGQEPVVLAERLAAWHRLLGTARREGSELSAPHYSTLRRYLYRQAYLDLPRLMLLPLLLADHDAYLHHPALASKRLATETEEVFIPLAEMLGMWRLRRRWVEKSQELLADTDVHLQRLSQDIKGLLEQASPSAIREGRRPLIKRQVAYIHLEQEIIKRAQKLALRPRPRVQRMPVLPGAVLRQRREGRLLDDLVNRLKVRILCASQHACYRVLDIVHSLGQPSETRFRDYIAAPKSNGYQALHTTITYRAPKSVPGELQVECHILTPYMLLLNECGAIAACHRSPRRYKDAPAWWTAAGLEQLSGFLRGRYRHQGGNIQAFLAQYDVGTRSDPLYIFTPHGHLTLLKQGSSPLDFAYVIHSELGRHAAKAEVNGRPVPHNYPLCNGDLVRIHYDQHFAGPELAWLHYVAMSSVKAKIRAGLRSRVRHMHPGRAAVEHHLSKASQYYQNKKGYHLVIPTARIEAFLRRVAQWYGLPDLDALYAAITEGRFLPQKLVHSLISEEMVGALVITGHGQRSQSNGHRILLCGTCRPVPGEPIVGYERRMGGRQKKLMIHHRSDPKCQRPPYVRGREVAVRWAEQIDAKDKLTGTFEIHADDRYKLLYDVLEVVYGEREACLRQVEALTDRHGMANLDLVIEAISWDRLENIQKRIQDIPKVHQVLLSPASPTQSLVHVPSGQRQVNPYTLMEVYDRGMFYDREDEINAIVKWLVQDTSGHRLIVHGQRRVGKTSLARYLMHETLLQRPMALPVFVDMQGFSLSETTDIATNIATYIVQTVYHAIDCQAPSRGCEEPMLWCNRALEAAVKHLGSQRLLLIIDEFNILLDRVRNGHLDQQVLSNLLFVMNARRDLYWLLIVQDVHFQDAVYWQTVGKLFQQAVAVHLKHFEEHWARKLVCEPAERHGFRYEEERVPVQLLALTAGNPYLIQVLCFRLIEQAKHSGRTNITEDDLESIIVQLLNDGDRYFAHLLEKLSGMRKIVFAAVAASTYFGEWANLEKVVADLQLQEHHLHAEALGNAVKELTLRGVLARRGAAEATQVRIPIALFHRWATGRIRLEHALDEWRSKCLKSQ